MTQMMGPSILSKVIYVTKLRELADAPDSCGAIQMDLKTLSTKETWRYWSEPLNKLPGKNMDAPFLEILKT